MIEFYVWPSAADLAYKRNISRGAAQVLLTAVEEFYGTGKAGLACLNYVVDLSYSQGYLERLADYQVMVHPIESKGDTSIMKDSG
jgi:hypothetical protein